MNVDEVRSLARSVGLAVRPTIKATERNHAGNQYRAKTSSGKTRCWRRQVSQFIVTRSRERFLKIKGSGRRLTHIASVSWRQFRARATMSERRGIGGCGLRQYINTQSALNKGKYGRQEFAAKRQEWAHAYKDLSELRRREVMANLAQTQLVSKAVIDSDIGMDKEANVPKQHIDQDFIAQTHWENGSALYPLGVHKFLEYIDDVRAVAAEATGDVPIAGREGMRRLARRALPEDTLIVPPSGQTLRAPGRKECGRKHLGFCRTAHAQVEDLYNIILRHVKTTESEQGVGKTLLRFIVDLNEDVDEGPLQVFHFSTLGSWTGHATLPRTSSVSSWRATASLSPTSCAS